MDASGSTPGAAGPIRLSRTGRYWRLGAAALAVALLLAGSAWGQDDAFPFGPMKMFATRQRLDGATSWYDIDGVTADGEVVDIPMAELGLRRAELEGQMDRLVDDPTLIGLLLPVYERRHPGADTLVELRVVKHLRPVRGGVPTGTVTERIVATWTR